MLMDIVACPSSSQQEALCPNPAFHGPFPENSESLRQPVFPLSRLLSPSTYMTMESGSRWGLCFSHEGSAEHPSLGTGLSGHNEKTY